MSINFGYTTNPGYIDLFVGYYKVITWHYRFDNWDNYSFPWNIIDDFKRFYKFPYQELPSAIYLVIGFTLLRYIFEIIICKPLLKYLNLTKKSDREKFPESLWKTIIYSFFWSYSTYLVVFNYDYFNHPERLFDDWLKDDNIPYDINILYLVEASFYIHSIYATIFMDLWRKDFMIMLVHHFVTVALLVGSHGLRLHRFGLLVMFFHDVNDLLLEFTKCNNYLKERNGKYYRFHEIIAFIGFASFTVTWFLFRLYWFPLKVLYASGVVAAYRAYHIAYDYSKFYALFNILLIILFFLNVYWFYLILRMLYRLSKNIQDTDDIRDFDANQKNNKKNE